MATPQKKHTWKFYRIGALDQVAIETADDLLHLCDLDQKLWVALSCPVKHSLHPDIEVPITWNWVG